MTPGPRLAEELDVLLARRRTVQASLARTDGPGDRGDQAAVLELADELARLDDRIGEIRRELHRTGRADDLLTPGTRVVVRYPDGSEEELHVGDAGEVEGAGGEELVTPDSPLGLALIGRHPGDRIRYATPGGWQVAYVVDVRSPQGRAELA